MGRLGQKCVQEEPKSVDHGRDHPQREDSLWIAFGNPKDDVYSVKKDNDYEDSFGGSM